MMEAPFDIVLVGDPRFPGGTASAMAEEAAAAARAGYRVGLVGAESSVLRFPHPFNPKLRALIDGGALALVPPGARAAAGLALLHGPFAAGLLPFAGLGLRAERRLLVLHQPPADAGGRPYYDLARVRVHAEEMLDGAVTLAPVGPLVRAQLDALPERPPKSSTRRNRGAVPGHRKSRLPPSKLNRKKDSHAGSRCVDSCPKLIASNGTDRGLTDSTASPS